MHELPLVFLTVLAQASAGTFFVMMVLKFHGKTSPSQESNLMLTSLILLAVAGIASTFHLGQPLRAINSLFGIGRSPMSNEIVAIGLYGGALFIAFMERFLTKLPKVLFTVAKLVALVASVLLVIAITRVYQLDTVPAWNTYNTTLSMILTALVCGGAINIVFGGKVIPAVIMVLSSLVLIACAPSYIQYITSVGDSVNLASMCLWSVKYTLLITGVILLTICATKPNKCTSMAILGTIVIVVAELAGRIAFYDLWSVSM